MPTMLEIVNLTFEHIFMVTCAVFLATIISVPLAIVIYKKDFYVNGVVNVVSLLQAFPSLGLFAIFVPLIGIGMKTVILALFLYALMPIFVNTIHGFKTINPDYSEIIDSLNISKRDLLFKIQLPLVMPHIINGIRITTIYTISLATIGTLVGAGGLGDLIYLGLQELNIYITLSGIIPILILTILANVLLNQLEKYFQTADMKYLGKQL